MMMSSNAGGMTNIGGDGGTTTSNASNGNVSGISNFSGIPSPDISGPNTKPSVQQQIHS